MSDRKRQAPEVVALLGVMAIAAAFRFWGINFGLPYTYIPDEPHYAQIGIRILQTEDLNPHSFMNPSLTYYIASVVYLLRYAYGALQGSLTSPSDLHGPEQIFLGGGLAGDTYGLLAARICFAILGISTVLVVYFIGANCYSKRVALLAALLTAVSPTHGTLLIHGVNPHIPMVFLLAISFYFSCQALSVGRTRDYLLAGLLTGLAASANYNGLLGLVPISLAYLSSDKRKSLPLFIGAAAAICIGFSIGTPFSILSPDEFLSFLWSK